MKNITIYPMRHHKSTLLFLLMVALLTLIVISTSCESHSGQLAKQPLEKVVIVDGVFNSSSGVYTYKVNRINHGVVSFIHVIYHYDTGDTIYFRFVQ